jgi:ParB-like chromosome segregation protein Spo0J
MMAQPKPLSDAEKQSIRDLHAEGLSRNAIAKRVGRSPAAVTALCKREGLAFPAETNTALVAARAVSAKERTLAAHERQLRIVEHQQAKLLRHYDDHEQWKTKIKGKAGAERLIDLDFIPPEDERNTTGAISNSIMALSKLAPTEDAGREAAVSIVEALAASLGLPPEAPQ